ncbi:MAG: hypothetical protein LBB59_03355 [Campylobacteraceae bacterium]|jgi:hypothetical protein|nr:hypothetical protein [Campylobacteraceae bacterium]
MGKVDKFIFSLKPSLKELAEILGMSYQTVKAYRMRCPVKLDLMLGGIKYRRLIKELYANNISIKFREDKK